MSYGYIWSMAWYGRDASCIQVSNENHGLLLALSAQFNLSLLSRSKWATFLSQFSCWNREVSEARKTATGSWRQRCRLAGGRRGRGWRLGHTDWTAGRRPFRRGVDNSRRSMVGWIRRVGPFDLMGLSRPALLAQKNSRPTHAAQWPQKFGLDQWLSGSTRPIPILNGEVDEREVLAKSNMGRREYVRRFRM
jgi:hypothetical protein